MTDSVSADTERLDAFAARAAADDVAMGSIEDALTRGRNQLALLPLRSSVETSGIGAYGALREEMTENGRRVGIVSEALKLWGTSVGPGRYIAPAGLIDSELDEAYDDLLDELVDQLDAGGLAPDEAAKLRAEIEAAMEADPSLTFRDAVLAGTAAHGGFTVEELEQRQRALALHPPEVAAVLGEHYDDIAGLAGRDGELTVEDLQAAAADTSLPEAVRDAAYRAAADSRLFDNLDVAAQTDLSDEPLGNGFRLDALDGYISPEDLEVFPAKDYQAKILLAWHPLVETANQGYDLTRADSHAGRDDVIAFIEDEDIPVHVRLAIAEIYADRHGITVEERQHLEYELALDPGGGIGGGGMRLDARASPVGSPPVAAPSPPPASRPAPRGGGPGAGYAAAIVIGATTGWSFGGRLRIERDGEPAVVITDPSTGFETAIDVAELGHLSPAELKAYVEYLAANGTPPPEGTTSVEPYPYLDQFGQWRMSDTNEPVWIPPPEGQFYDADGYLRWNHNQELVDEVEPELEPQPASDGAGARDGSGDDDDHVADDGDRIFNVTRHESPVWAATRPFRGKTRTNGLQGRARRYYEWDRTHNDIEVYDHKERHLGSMDPLTGRIYKGPVPGRTPDF